MNPHDEAFQESESLLKSKPPTMKVKIIPSEQFANFDYADPDMDGFDGFDKVWNELAEVIGRCMIVFGELEVNLEDCLHELINDRSDQLGMLTTRQLTYVQKAQLYIDLLRAWTEQEDGMTDDVSLLKKHLVRSGEIRNVIAHAKWPSLTKDGYIFSFVDPTSSAGGMPDLRYYKLDKEGLENLFDYLNGAANLPYHIYEKYIER